MSSGIYAKLLTNRRIDDRAAAELASLSEDDGYRPIDIVIDDLSSAGCHISAELDLAVDDRVTIALPGVGACPAQVASSGEDGIALIFHHALTGHDVDRARETSRLVERHFGRPGHRPGRQADEPDGDNLSWRRRLAIILSAAIAAWCLTLIVIWALRRLI